MVLCHTISTFVTYSQSVLRIGIALLGGQTKPFHRFFVVLLHTQTVEVA